jgi:ubiquinone/menaquinone biosynthesis C-methylase UbiE
MDSTVPGNVYNKYATRNPVARVLFQNFLRNVRELLEQVSAESVLEVGCGEGYLTRLVAEWLHPSRICGIDLSARIFDPEGSSSSSLFFSCQSAYQLGFRRECFDLVIGAEVLEHLRFPLSALTEIHRVTSRFVLFTVPREPIWRVLNLVRFAYWHNLGNTPGHLQHWSSKSFMALVSRSFDILEVRKPLPWTVVLAVKKAPGS